MQVIKILLSIWIILAITLFIYFIVTKQNVKFTNYKTNEIKYLEGFKRIGCFVLMSLLWPYIVIKNLIKGE